jgi:hypothetical protein
MIRLHRAGEQVRLPVTRNGTLQPRQVRPGELDQLETEGGIKCRPVLCGDHFECPGDVLGKSDGNGAKRQQGRQNVRCGVAERILYLPSVHRCMAT